jgi:hypothetical protein
MKSKPMAAIDDLSSQQFYHGTKADLKPGEPIESCNPPDVGEQDRMQYFSFKLKIK